MRYQQFRIAKRNGEIIQQRRYVHVTTKSLFKWWQFWKWAKYECEYEYEPWEDLPIVNVESEE